MVSQAIVFELLAKLRDYVEKLRPLQAKSEQEFNADYVALWAVQHGLQMAAQCVLDICNHVVSDVSTEHPTNYRELILAAGRLGLMPEDFARRFSHLAGFRNVLIHEYAKVDPSEVYRNLRDGLADFDRFAEYVRFFLEKTP
ncbi:MAG TPA: DUF86 domain-containing protein [Candidatus Acidoferrum sp.]|nr:DUF86 domain-containing protein [Candidatus Methylomirabilis sp.]HWU36178.1 DUF86 domain-containing protein [Candidatus Acidoferrum sp.]